MILKLYFRSKITAKLQNGSHIWDKSCLVKDTEKMKLI